MNATEAKIIADAVSEALRPVIDQMREIIAPPAPQPPAPPTEPTPAPPTVSKEDIDKVSDALMRAF